MELQKKSCEETIQSSFHDKKKETSLEDAVENLTQNLQRSRNYKMPPKEELEGLMRELKEKDLQESAIELRRQATLASIPEGYEGCTFDNYKVKNDGQRLALISSQWFVRQIQSEEKSKSILFIGSYGTGKTHLACAIMKALEGTCSSIYRKAKDIPAHIRRCIDEPLLKEENVIKTYVDPGLLVIDELTPSSLSEHGRGVIFDVIDGRYCKQNPTLLISNFSIEVVQESIGGASYDRLMAGKAPVVEFFWESAR